MKKHILYYNRLVKRYNKYQRKLVRAKTDVYHYRRIDVLLKRIKELSERIEEIGSTLKRVAAGSAVAMSMMLVPTQVDGQDFTLQTSRPFGLAHAQNFAAPSWADVDNDDDMDLVIGERYGDVQGGLFVWRNDDGEFTLDGSLPPGNLWLQIDSVHNIPDRDNGGAYNRPGFVDVDGDGDQDMFVGQNAGDGSGGVTYDRIRYFENDGTAYVEKFGAENPLSGFVDGDYTKPTFEDLDNDGDLDAVIGKGNGEIVYWENDGSGNFAAAATNPFAGISVGERAAPSFADLDGDGDLDAFVGNKDGELLFLANSGDASAPVFALDTVNNPFGNPRGDLAAFNSEAQTDVVPTFMDLDGDGDKDLIAGGLNGPLMYLENDGGSFTWIEANDIGIYDIGNGAIPTIADADEDGDLDVLLSKGSDVTFFTNDGGMFDDTKGNPFDIVNSAIVDSISADLSPEFVDWNGDMYIDLFVGTQEGPIFYFENNGDNTWSDMTLTDSNPFKDYDPVGKESLAFIDVDNDGDLDCFVGNKDGNLLYFENDGAGNLTQTAGPFDNIDFGGNRLVPSTYDVDRDGDLDMLIGKEDGTSRYFVNNGDGTFAEGTGDANPFDGIRVVAVAAPTFGDLNADGVQDLLISERAGQSWFFTNSGTATPPVADGSIEDLFALEGTPVSIDASGIFSDPDNDIWSYRAKQADGSPIPAWLSFDRLTQTLSGTPGAANVGQSYDIMIEAIDADNNIASTTFNITVAIPTGIDPELDGLSIYPNPVDSKLSITVDWKSEVELELFTLSGVRIKSARFNGQTFQLDVNDLRKGVYLLKLSSSEGVISRQIIKQ